MLVLTLKTNFNRQLSSVDLPKDKLNVINFLMLLSEIKNWKLTWKWLISACKWSTNSPPLIIISIFAPEHQFFSLKVTIHCSLHEWLARRSWAFPKKNNDIWKLFLPIRSGLSKNLTCPWIWNKILLSCLNRWERLRLIKDKKRSG